MKLMPFDEDKTHRHLDRYDPPYAVTFREVAEFYRGRGRA